MKGLNAGDQKSGPMNFFINAGLQENFIPQYGIDNGGNILITYQIGTTSGICRPSSKIDGISLNKSYKDLITRGYQFIGETDENGNKADYLKDFLESGVIKDIQTIEYNGITLFFGKPEKNKDQTTLFEKLGIILATKIDGLIGQEHKVLEGKFEGLISNLIGKTGEELLNELRITKNTIEQLSCFSNEEYKQFIRYLFSKRIITKENFEQCSMIFEGHISETDRLLIKN